MHPDTVMKRGDSQESEPIPKSWKVLPKFERVEGEGQNQSGIEKKGIDQIHSRVSILSILSISPKLTGETAKRVVS